jgi:hypothetical protein
MVEHEAHEYLAAISRELRVRRRYRRRVLAELAAHIEDAVADERSRGASTEEAVRRSLDRLGGAEALAAGLTVAHRDSIAVTQRRAIRLTGYLGAAVCCSVAETRCSARSFSAACWVPPE